MDGVPVSLESEGTLFEVWPVAGSAAVTVRASTGEYLRLEPWTLAQHLDALEQHLNATEDDLQLDVPAFARALFAQCARAEGASAECASAAPSLNPMSTPWSGLALWWCGALETTYPPSPSGWLILPSGQLRLKSWTWAERQQAITSSVTLLAGGARSVRLSHYLRALVVASVAEVVPPTLRPLSLMGAEGLSLLHAVVALNLAPETDSAFATPVEPALARRQAQETLRVCRALGWTPAQVMATPSRQIEQLLLLLDRAEAPAQATLTSQAMASPSGTGPTRSPHSSAPKPRGLSAFPDSVIIQVEDDP